MFSAYNSASRYIGLISVWAGFNPPRFSIRACTDSSSKFPTDPPVGDNKVWTISKTDSALTIECNEVELVSLIFAENGCADQWGQQVKQIKFSSYDEASDSYRANAKPSGNQCIDYHRAQIIQSSPIQPFQYRIIHCSMSWVYRGRICARKLD